MRIYDDEISKSKKFSKEYLYFSIWSPIKIGLGIKAQFYQSGEENPNWKNTKKINVFDSWAERMHMEGKAELLGKKFFQKKSVKIKFFGKLAEEKNLATTEEIEKRPYLQNLLVSL